MAWVKVLPLDYSRHSFFQRTEEAERRKTCLLDYLGSLDKGTACRKGRVFAKAALQGPRQAWTSTVDRGMVPLSLWRRYRVVLRSTG
jgi:hypothetical protein